MFHQSLKVSDDGATHCVNFLWTVGEGGGFIHLIYVLLKPQHSENWFYFRLQVKDG
jgi:hypothetical protein